MSYNHIKVQSFNNYNHNQYINKTYKRIYNLTHKTQPVHYFTVTLAGSII